MTLQLSFARKERFALNYKRHIGRSSRPIPILTNIVKRRISWKYPQRHDKSAARFEKGGALPKGHLNHGTAYRYMSILIIT